MLFYKSLAGSGHGCKTAFHICGTTTVQDIADDVTGKRGMPPFFIATGWHDIGVPCKDKEGGYLPATHPQVADITKAQILALETGTLELFKE
jgi:hypothetical protein